MVCAKYPGGNIVQVLETRGEAEKQMLSILGREADLSVWEDRYLHLWRAAPGRRMGADL